MFGNNLFSVFLDSTNQRLLVALHMFVTYNILCYKHHECIETCWVTWLGIRDHILYVLLGAQCTPPTLKPKCVNMEAVNFIYEETYIICLYSCV